MKLAYNGVHHYLPIINKGLTDYFDAYNNAMHFTRNARSALKNFHNLLSTGSTYQQLVKIGYKALTSTTTVLSGCNPHTGTTGTTGAATPAIFNFPVEPPPPPRVGRKRRRGVTPGPSSSGATGATADVEGPEEEEGDGDELEFEAPEDDSPVVTLGIGNSTQERLQAMLLWEGRFPDS